MRLRTFRAASMAAAIAQVREELGPEALILNTRRIAGGIEITAALESEPAPLEVCPNRLSGLAWHAVPPALHRALALGEPEQAVAAALPFGALPLDAGARPLMLSGPPGAGKTLTAVRLATRLVVGGCTPLVITTDGCRAGANEQLAAFTRLLGLPLLVATNPTSLGRALAERRDGMPVLIDTAGTDPFEPARTDQLRRLAAAADAVIAAVLPAGLDPGEAADLATACGGFGAAHLVVTRLDLVRRMGGVVAAAAASGLPLTEAGIGPGAADGLVPFTPALLAARLTRFEEFKDGK